MADSSKIIRKFCGELAPISICAEIEFYHGHVQLAIFIAAGESALQLFGGEVESQAEFREIMAVLSDLSNSLKEIVDELGENWLKLLSGE